MSSDGSLIERFRGADTTDLPELLRLGGRHQVFWVLRVGQEQLGVDIMTPGEISAVLRDAYGVSLSWQKIEAVLSGERGTVAKRKKERRRAYQLMASGAEEVESAGATVRFIEPTHGYTGLRETHEVLGDLDGDLRVCDPYADKRTLDMLSECEAASSIRLLTRNVDKPAGFKQAMKAFAKEYTSIEARTAGQGILHDRYMIYESGMLLLGTSLNGVGLKQTFVVALGPDIRTTVLAAFEATWDTATPL